MYMYIGISTIFPCPSLFPGPTLFPGPLYSRAGPARPICWALLGPPHRWLCGPPMAPPPLHIERGMGPPRE